MKSLDGAIFVLQVAVGHKIYPFTADTVADSSAKQVVTKIFIFFQTLCHLFKINELKKPAI